MAGFQLVPQSEQDSDNRSLNTARMLNCYLEPVGQDMTIKSVLGMTAFATVEGVFTRAVAEIEGRIYVVRGGGLYQIIADGTVTRRGDVDDSPETSISSNTGSVTVTAGGKYYTWDGTTLSQPTAGAFTAFGSVSYIGGLTVLTELNGNRLQWSDVRDPSTLDGLSFNRAAAFDDDILRGMAIGGSFFVFKEKSIEQFYQNGADLASISSSGIEYGLKAYNLLSKTPNGAFFVSSENKVMLMAGQPQPISTRGVETALESATPTHCFFYQDEGHDFCAIRFDDRPSWVYDMATGFWHERSEGDITDAWSAVGSVRAFGAWHVALFAGDVVKLERTNIDATGPLIRQITTKTIRMDGNRFKVTRLEVEGRVGYSALGRDAIITLQISRDGGNTWTEPKPRSMGDVGNYNVRAVWRQLGQAREATARLTWADAAEIPINNTAFLDVS